MPPGQLKKNLQNIVDAVGGMFDIAILEGNYYGHR